MKVLFTTLTLLTASLSFVTAQEGTTELHTSEIKNEKATYDIEEIKKLLYVPKDHRCDTSVILKYKKTFARCYYQGVESLNISHLGREYIEGEGPKLLFTSENFYLENGEPKYAHEKEYYHHVDKTTREKSIRSWEGYYVITNGKAVLVKEIEEGKERRDEFEEQAIVEFYQNANQLLEAAEAEKRK